MTTKLLTDVEADVWDPRETRWHGIGPLEWSLSYGPSDDTTTYRLRLWGRGDTVRKMTTREMHEDDGVWDIHLTKNGNGAVCKIETEVEGVGAAIVEAQEWMMKHGRSGWVDPVYKRLKPLGYR